MGGTGVSSFTLEELESMITVEMGNYRTAGYGTKLITWDLGSCVGIAVRDPAAGVGGLLHIMLPHHAADRSGEPFIASKYADTGLDEMVRALVRQGAGRERLVAKLAGGAHMIKAALVPENMDISARNLEAVEKKLGELKIPVIASDVGGHHPRTVVFETGSGAFRIVSSGRADRII